MTALRDPAIALHAVWLAFGASWIAAAGWRGRTRRAATGWQTRAPLILAGVGFGALFAETPRPRHAAWFLPLWLGWAMVAIAIGAVAFAWWARLHLGRLWSGGIVAREGHRVVDTGPYALVRHPIYTALIVAAVALAVAKASAVALVGAVLIAIAFAWKARVEERFLRAVLGAAAYDAYAARVPMLVPFAR